MDNQQAALERAIGTLTRVRKISVYLGDNTDPEEYTGHMLFSNDTHIIINCEDGTKVFLLRTFVTRLEERPI